MSSQSKKFARRIRNEDPKESSFRISNDGYLSFIYETLLESLAQRTTESTDETGMMVELGSAGGITKLLLPHVMTSDVRQSPGVDLTSDATVLPFRSNSIDRVIAKDVLHHLPKPTEHFYEIARVLKVNGIAAYSEPNWNVLSRIVFRYFHPEPFESKQKEWSRRSSDPMDSNQALAKIVFERDLMMFKSLFPQFEVAVCSPTYGISYLLSGGVYKRSVIPSPWLKSVARLESRFPAWLRVAGINRVIILTKRQ